VVTKPNHVLNHVGAGSLTLGKSKLFVFWKSKLCNQTLLMKINFINEGNKRNLFTAKNQTL